MIIYEFGELVRLAVQLYKDDSEVIVNAIVYNSDYEQVDEIPLIYRGEGLHAQMKSYDAGYYTATYKVVFDNGDPDGYETTSELFKVLDADAEPLKSYEGEVSSEMPTAYIGVTNEA